MLRYLAHVKFFRNYNLDGAMFGIQHFSPVKTYQSVVHHQGLSSFALLRR